MSAPGRKPPRLDLRILDGAVLYFANTLPVSREDFAVLVEFRKLDEVTEIQRATWKVADELDTLTTVLAGIQP